MEFEFILQETTPRYQLKMYGRKNVKEKLERAGFRSFTKKPQFFNFYEGIIEIKVIGISLSPYFFFFKTYEVRDTELPGFSFKEIFNTDTALPIAINSFCYRVLHEAIEDKKLPFCFIEITKNFMNDDMEDAEVRIERGEDSWG